MSFLHVACGLAVFAAAGHSFLSERIYLGPLREETAKGSVFSRNDSKRLATAMFHMASLAWVTMAASMVVLEPGHAGYRTTLHLFAGIFAISGVGNFWVAGRPHPGGVILLAASILVLCSLYM